MSSLQEVMLALPAYGERRALGLRGNFGFRWWSYEEIFDLAVRVARFYEERGLQPGARVLLWSANSPEWVACLLGAAWRGLVIVPVDARSDRDEVHVCWWRTEAALLLVGDEQRPERLGVNIVRLTTLNSLGSELSTVTHAQAIRVRVRDGDAAVLLFTAGSSGEPRGVILTHGNLRSQIEHFSYWRALLRWVPTRLLALSPLSHVQGLMLSACVPLSLGMTVIYSASIEPEHLRRCLLEGHVRALSTVPRVLATLQTSIATAARQQGSRLDWLGRRSLLGARFRVILVGGATLPETAERFWRRLGCVMVQGYGSTETTAFVTVNRPLLGRRGSVGKVFHRGSLQLSAEGEILVRGPHLSPGYLGEADGSQRTEDGFLRTGDLARKDRFGRLYFLGRLQDRIVTAEGHTLHPNAIETALREVDPVRDAVVMAWRQDGLEEVHAALLIAPQSAAQAVAEANRRLPEASRIRSWTVWPEPDFPRGALGKPRREQVIARTKFVLAQGIVTEPPRIEADTLEQAAEDPDRPHRLKRVRDILLRQKERPTTFAALHSVLRPLGMDSIDTAEVLTLLREAEHAGSATIAMGTEPGEFPPPSSAPRRSPRWQRWPGAALWRILIRGVFLGIARIRIAHIGIRARAQGELPAGIPPVIFAVHGEDREHPVEYLAILMCLPWRYRRRLTVVVGDRLLFGSHFFLKPEDGMWRRLYASCMVRFGVSSVVPYILFLGSTVAGIGECCRAIDAGFSPLLRWNRVAATMACETGARVVPIRLRGSRRSWWSADLRIEFGEALRPLRTQSVTDFAYAVEERTLSMSRKFALQG